jgi:F-type H+/Na+-transporting ATPase subunit alpha
MFDNSLFAKLVEEKHPTGEVVSVDRFMVTAKGLGGVSVGALVLFESGQHGMVREVGAETVLILNLEAENSKLGQLVVLETNQFVTPVGESLIGRVVNALAQPIDGKGPIRFEATWPVYNKAPGIMERSQLKDQLPSGVLVVDTLFPIVLGQRIAVLGDAKSGKSSFLQQLGISQINTDRIVVYVLIGKRRVEINQLVGLLNETGAMANSIVVVADMFDSLAQSYLAPYIGCSIAEYLWYNNRDVVIIYDDLSSHAKVYREVSLLSQANPGRDSYPGDMFFAHSSLLERAGKLASSGKTLTALPAVVTPSDDITAYLPTSIMSITDGQIIFDLSIFRQNIRPAVNAGLSVSRVGGRARNPRQKIIADVVFKKLAEYRQAAEFAHFGSDMAPETKLALEFGRLINETFRQAPTELYTLVEQELILEAILASGGHIKLNVPLLKKQVRAISASVKGEGEVDSVVQQLLQEVTVGAQA